MNYLNFLIAIITISLFLLLYYKFFKELIYATAPKVTHILCLDAHYPLTKANGVIELILIAFSHLLFCAALVFIYHLNFKTLGFNHFNLWDVFYGLLLGMGVMSVTTFMCRLSVQALSLLAPKNIPADTKAWIALARGGWMRHHSHNLQILPFALSLLVLFIQIGSEETIFRGIILNHFLHFGAMIAITISTGLFVIMQALQTPKWVVAFFPMTGALISGVVFGFLYTKTFCLYPLIIAHFLFFGLCVF